MALPSGDLAARVPCQGCLVEYSDKLGFQLYREYLSFAGRMSGLTSILMAGWRVDTAPTRSNSLEAIPDARGILLDLVYLRVFWLS